MLFRSCGRAQPHRSPLSHPPLPTCLALRSLRPRGLEGPRVLSQRPLLCLLLLLLRLLLRPGTRVQTTPGTSSTLSPRERTRALRRAFPLVDGGLQCVRAGGGRWGPSLALDRGGGPEHAELVGRLPHTTPGCPLHHLRMPFPFSVIPSLVGTPQPRPQLLLV